MSTYTDRQQWYRNEYLKSRWWKTLRKKVIEKYGYICAIDGCGRNGKLYPHHLTYKRIKTPQEIYDLVPLCWFHHFLCHYQWFHKIPLTAVYLTKRYQYLQAARWRRIRPSTIVRW